MTPQRAGILTAVLALGLTSGAGARPAPTLAISTPGVGKKGFGSRLFERPHTHLHLRLRHDDEALRPRTNGEAEERALIRQHSADLWHLYDRELNRSPRVHSPGTARTEVERAQGPRRIRPGTPQASASTRTRPGRPVALARKLRLIGKRMPRRPPQITWFTYYRKVHRSPYVRPLVKATSIALGASIRGYYSLTFGMQMRAGGNRPPSFAPVVRGW